MKCILITGIGHSGTRLMVKMLGNHPDVSVPFSILNELCEYVPLSETFMKFIRLTPFSSEDYFFNEEKLVLVLKEYLKHIDKDKKYFVIKEPYLPLNYLDFFLRHFRKKIIFVYMNRPKEKIISSFVRRGEHNFFFQDKLIDYCKVFAANQREEILSWGDPIKCLDKLIDLGKHKQKEWDKKQKKHKFIDIDIERFVTSKIYLSGILKKMNLYVNNDCMNFMLSVVDKKRLLSKDKKDN